MKQYSQVYPDNLTINNKIIRTMKTQIHVTRKLIEALPSIRIRTGSTKFPTSITFSWIIFSFRIIF